MIVEAAKHEEQDRNAGGEGEQTLLGEDIVLEEAVGESADGFLLVCIDAVERGEIEVGGSVGDVRIGAVCAEQVYVAVSMGFGGTGSDEP